MDLRQLRFFLEIANCGGFTKAAEKLYIAQSALSTAIKNLEDELGTELFSRKNKRVTLTPEGELLAEHAVRILRMMDRAHQEIGDMKNLMKGEVRVGLTPMLSSFFFPKIIASFKRKYPNMRLSIIGDSARNLRRRIENGELDIGVIVGDAPESLDSHSILREEIIACVSKNHRFAGNRTMPLKDLLNEPLLLFGNGYSIREIIDEAARREGMTITPAAESNLFSLLRSLAKEELGVAFLLKMAVINDSDITAVSCSPQLFINMSIAWKKNTALSAANKVFIQFIINEVDEYYMLTQAAETFPLP